MPVWGPGIWQNDSAVSVITTIEAQRRTRRSPATAALVTAAADEIGLPHSTHTSDPHYRFAAIAFTAWLIKQPRALTLQCPTLMWSFAEFLDMPWRSLVIDPSGYEWKPVEARRRQQIERDLTVRMRPHIEHLQARAAALAISTDAELRLLAAQSPITPLPHLTLLSRDGQEAVSRAAAETFLQHLGR